MINSLKQFIRKPIKLILLMVLIMSSTIIFIYGFTLYRYSKQQLELLNSSYSTIGFIEQKVTSTKVETLYDPSLKMYVNYKVPIYDPLFTENVLSDYEEYILKPEKRPFYVAYMESYKTSIEDTIDEFQNTIEFTPIQTSVLDKPILVKVTKVLDGYLEVGNLIWLYNYYSNENIVLQKDNKYIAMVGKMDNIYNESKKIDYVYVPMICPTSILYDKFGNIRESTINKNELIEEVTTHFYTKGRGMYWKNMVDLIKRFEKSIPVLPTNALELLPSFHGNQSYVVSGRKISKDEFKTGKKVCMISQVFANKNELVLGDKISLPLYLSNHDESSYSMFGESYDVTFLDTTGETLSIFSSNQYEIIGIYNSQISSYNDSELSEDTVIIPMLSVQESDENNLIAVGPMRKTTTSFQIPNGTMNKYKKWFEENNLTQTFDLTLDDGGYEKIQNEISSNFKTANIMCAIGVITFLLTIIIIIYFFIIKDGKRIAINRSLGMSKKRCCMSILYGLIVFTLIASILGSIISYKFISKMGFMNEFSYYSYDYSKHRTIEEKEEIDINYLVSTTAYITPICFTLLISSISVIVIYKNIDSNLMLLLNNKN